MLERELTLYGFAMQLCRRAVADIEPHQLSLVPSPGTKPPVWILGHLAVASDGALRLLGQPTTCPRAWHVSFGRGSEPLSAGSVSPSKAELLDALERNYQLVAEAAATAQPAEIDRPHSFEPLLGTPLKTVGDLIGHILTVHMGLHLGQLSIWRRQMGIAPIL